MCSNRPNVAHSNMSSRHAPYTAIKDAIVKMGIVHNRLVDADIAKYVITKMMHLLRQTVPERRIFCEVGAWPRTEGSNALLMRMSPRGDSRMRDELPGIMRGRQCWDLLTALRINPLLASMWICFYADALMIVPGLKN